MAKSKTHFPFFFFLLNFASMAQSPSYPNGSGNTLRQTTAEAQKSKEKRDGFYVSALSDLGFTEASLKKLTTSPYYADVLTYAQVKAFAQKYAHSSDEARAAFKERIAKLKRPLSFSVAARNWNSIEVEGIKGLTNVAILAVLNEKQPRIKDFEHRPFDDLSNALVRGRATVHIDLTVAASSVISDYLDSPRYVGRSVQWLDRRYTKRRRGGCLFFE